MNHILHTQNNLTPRNHLELDIPEISLLQFGILIEIIILFCRTSSYYNIRYDKSKYQNLEILILIGIVLRIDKIEILISGH